MCNRNRKKKEALHVVILTAIWCIWEDKNDVVFNGKRRSYHSLFKEVQNLSFFWVKHRAKWISLSWENWCKFDV
ncbi:hypothetical protein R6Q59_012666 [Mikania micrantha]